MQAIVLADGAVGSRAALDRAWPGWADPDPLVIAADGGARHAEPLGLAIDHWVGDGDSVDAGLLERLVAAGTTIERAPTDKDESDTELAILAAIAAGAERIAIVGATGGPRLDHLLANVALLGLEPLAGIDARLVGVDARIRLVRAPGPDGRPVDVALDGRPGDLVTLLPLGGPAVGLTTDGLRFPLADETIGEGRTRGLSNVRVGPLATVTIRSGRLVVVETPASL